MNKFFKKKKTKSFFSALELLVHFSALSPRKERKKKKKTSWVLKLMFLSFPFLPDPTLASHLFLLVLRNHYSISVRLLGGTSCTFKLMVWANFPNRHGQRERKPYGIRQGLRRQTCAEGQRDHSRGSPDRSKTDGRWLVTVLGGTFGV